MKTNEIIELTELSINNLSVSMPIKNIKENGLLNSWKKSQGIPDVVTHYTLSPILMVNTFNKFDLRDFIEKDDKEYSNEEYITQVMQYLGYTSIYDMMKNNHPQRGDNYFEDMPVVWMDNEKTIYLILNENVFKLKSDLTIGDKIDNFWSE